MAIRTVTIEVKMDISNAEGKISTLTGSLKLLGDEVKKTGKSTDDFERLVTKNMREGETAIQSLTRRSRELRGEIGNLRNEFGRSANKSVLGDLEKAKSDLKGIEGFLKNMGNDGGIAGHKFGDEFGKEFILSFRTIPEFLTSPIGGTLVGLLAPALVAGIAAAITAGVGLGVVGAGAYIERSNPRIQAVFAPLSTDLKNVFTDAAGPMVDPIVGALASIDVWVKHEKPALTGLFASVAPSVGLIARGAEGFISDLVPALTKVGDAFTSAFSDPGVQTSLRDLSTSFASLFETIGNNPQEVKDGILFINGALKGTLGLLRDIFVFVGPVVEALRLLRTVNNNPATGGFDPGLNQAQLTGQQAITPDQFHAAGGKGDVGDGKSHIVRISQEAEDAAKASGDFANNQKQAAQMIAAAAKAAADAVPDYKTLSATLGATAVTADTLAGQLTDKVFNAMMGMDVANNNFNKSLITVGDTIVSIGGHLTEHVKALKKTETGQQQETDAVLAAIQANLQVYDSQIAAGIGADDAAQAYDKNASALEAQVKSAGKVPPAVQKLIDKYAHVPDNVNTTITMQGLTNAINNLDETLRLINHLDGLHANASVTVTYYTKNKPHTGPLAQSFSRWGNIYQHADMGLVNAGIYAPPTRYAFAEPQTGGEAFVPKYGNYARSMGILSAAAGWYGAHVVPGGGRGGGGGGPMTLYVMGGDDTGRALIKTLRFAIGQGGGDPVYVLTPRGF